VGGEYLRVAALAAAFGSLACLPWAVLRRRQIKEQVIGAAASLGLLIIVLWMAYAYLLPPVWPLTIGALYGVAIGVAAWDAHSARRRDRRT